MGKAKRILGDGSHDRSGSVDEARLRKALLLLVSRKTLSDEQVAWARNALENLTDFDAFATLANRSFASPFLARHADAIRLEAAAPEIAEMMMGSTRFIASRNLLLAAEQEAFHTSCIVPVTDRYVFLKGPVIASALYRDLGLRPSRDIDVLVHPDDFEPLLRQAWSQGFVPLLAPGDRRAITCERDFRSLLRYSTNHVVLLSERGVMIEVHVEADTYATIPGNVFLENQIKVKTGPHLYQSLTLPCMFTYLCHHHARHFFSRAQWISDLELLRAHPNFSMSETLEFAARFGLETLVETCVSFSDLTGNPDQWTEHDPPGEAGEMLSCCLAVFGRSGTRERELARGRNHRNLVFSWDRASGGYDKLLQRIMQRRVSLRSERYMFLKFYVKRPLPLWLHWLYVFPRIRDGFSNRYKG